MKKIAATILALVYFCFTLTLVIKVHYCMGEMAGISFFDKEDQACRKCGMEKHNPSSDCCSNHTVIFKSSPTHIHADVTVPSFEDGTALLVKFFSTNVFLPLWSTEVTAHVHAPPLQGPFDLYLHHRTLRI